MIKNKGYRWLLLFLLIAVFPDPPVATVAATSRNLGSKLILVNLTRVDFADFNTVDYPYLQRLLTQGQVGLAVVRVAGGTTPGKIYLALNGALPGRVGEQDSALGVIGSTLRQAGKQTAFLGNAIFLAAEPDGKTLLCDVYGVVDHEIATGGFYGRCDFSLWFSD